MKVTYSVVTLAVSMAYNWPNHQLQYDVLFGRWKGRLFDTLRGWRIALILHTSAD
jgi:hypothetical protein